MHRQHRDHVELAVKLASGLLDLFGVMNRREPSKSGDMGWVRLVEDEGVIPRSLLSWI